jgi:hypothetical protein
MRWLLVCYACFALPEQAVKPTGQPLIVAFTPEEGSRHLDWRPYMIEPVMPPKVVGRLPQHR